MTKKHWLKIADEYANKVYGISAADVICGGDEQELLASWYCETQKVFEIYRFIDERAGKYELTVINQFDR